MRSARSRYGKLALVVAGAAFATWLLAPRAGELPAGLAALAGAHHGWLLAAALSAAAAYAASAVALQGVVPCRLPFSHVIGVQVATSFAAVVAPAGLGGLALNIRFLERSGVPRAQAVASVGLGRVTGAVVHATTLAALAPFALGSIEGVALPGGRVATAVAGAVAVVAASAWLSERVRARASGVLAMLAPARDRLRAVLSDPRRVTALVGGTLMVSLARALTLAAALRAVGAPAPVLAVVAVYLAAEAVGALGGTPGGLGLLDGAVLAGLSALGVLSASAVAAVLVFRLLTFWLPTAPGAVTLRMLRRAEVI